LATCSFLLQYARPSTRCSSLSTHHMGKHDRGFVSSATAIHPDSVATATRSHTLLLVCGQHLLCALASTARMTHHTVTLTGALRPQLERRRCCSACHTKSEAMTQVGGPPTHRARQEIRGVPHASGSSAGPAAAAARAGGGADAVASNRVTSVGRDLRAGPCQREQRPDAPACLRVPVSMLHVPGTWFPHEACTAVAGHLAVSAFVAAQATDWPGGPSASHHCQPGEDALARGGACRHTPRRILWSERR